MADMKTLLRFSRFVDLSVLFAFSTFVAAQTPQNLPRWEPAVKSVAVFKNGLGFVYKTGTTRFVDGWAQADALPPAVLGTVWMAGVGNTGPLTEVVSFKEKRPTQHAAATLTELLAANPGKRVLLTYVAGGSPQTVEGTLLGTLNGGGAREHPTPPEATAALARLPPIQPGAEELLMLRLDGGGQPILSVARSAVVTVQFRDDANLRIQGESETDGVKVRVTGSPASGEIAMAYMAKNIVWSPSYRLDIGDQKLAKLQLEAVLTNDLEDIKDAEVSFVVGYPNFMFADVTTPLSLDQSVEAFLQELSERRPAGQVSPFSNVMTQAVVYRPDRGPRRTAAPAYSIPQPVPGETSEDLYFFQKTGVSLKKGERARYTILTASVPYEHLYQCHLDDTLNVTEHGERRGSEDPGEEPRVWHVLRLENTTTQPWTTAPAFAVRGALPTAQDVLNYTPPGAKSVLKLTVATDVRAEQSQTETSRQVVTISRSTFDEVMVKGTVHFTNMKREPVNILARKSVIGEVLSSAEGKVTKVARNMTAINSTSEIEWEFPLPPGAGKELTYEYKLLIRR